MPQTIDEIPPTPINTVDSTVVSTGAWKTLKPISDNSKCIKCWICWKFCPDVAIERSEEGPVFDYDHCKGCGICANECPVKCIKMIPETK
ncbi:MAG: 4Fe-4S binding protein [Candidatus Thermoplasmatota archaeon]|nr:4Fe-4S binding protein [Candidatus Thermoplasmatota archaeon]